MSTSPPRDLLIGCFDWCIKRGLDPLDNGLIYVPQYLTELHCKGYATRLWSIGQFEKRLNSSSRPKIQVKRERHLPWCANYHGRI